MNPFPRATVIFVLALSLTTGCGPVDKPKIGVVYLFHGGFDEYSPQASWNATVQIFGYDPHSVVYGKVIWNAEAWPTLLFSEVAADNLGATKLGRARRFVFSEVIAHQIPISGAFKSFGLINYRGYFGGPYASPASYRRAVL